MPKFTASIAFSGKYKPAHFEGLDVYDAMVKLMCAMVDMPDDVIQSAMDLKKNFIGPSHRYNLVCHTVGSTHITLREGAYDPWLSAVTADMTPHPGLNYAEACNA